MAFLIVGVAALIGILIGSYFRAKTFHEGPVQNYLDRKATNRFIKDNPYKGKKPEYLKDRE